MMKQLGLAIALCIFASGAYACSSPVTLKDASATNQNFGEVVDSSNNCYPGVGIVDGTAAANKMQVDGNSRAATALPGTVPLSGTPTITASSAYVSGYCLGGLNTLSNAVRSHGPGSATVQSVIITDLSTQDVNIDAYFFDANPTSSTLTDHAACAIASADAGKVIGFLHVTDWDPAGIGVGETGNYPLSFGLPSGTTLYMQLIVRDAPTYTSTSAISYIVNLIED